MHTATASTVATQTRRGSAGLFIVSPAQTNHVPKPLTVALISLAADEKRSLPVEVLVSARGQGNPRLFHAATVFKTDQPAGNGVFPDRQMRATAPPGIRLGIAARRFRHPGEELLGQCIRG